MSVEAWKRAAEALKKYRLAALVVILGVLLMLLPDGTVKDAAPQGSAAAGETFDRAAVQEEMERILSAIDGTGRLRLMLTVDAGTKHELAQSSSSSRSGADEWQQKSEPLTIGAGSGMQEVVVTNSLYPRYVGALVVCEGGGSAGVRLAVTNAVSALTGLTSDRITVLQGKP